MKWTKTTNEDQSCILYTASEGSFTVKRRRLGMEWMNAYLYVGDFLVRGFRSAGDAMHCAEELLRKAEPVAAN